MKNTEKIQMRLWKYRGKAFCTAFLICCLFLYRFLHLFWDWFIYGESSFILQIIVYLLFTCTSSLFWYYYWYLVLVNWIIFFIQAWSLFRLPYFSFGCLSTYLKQCVISMGREEEKHFWNIYLLHSGRWSWCWYY